MLSLRKTLVLAAAALFIVSCTPEDGATGPVGPVGPEGAIGPAGPAGSDGVPLIVNTYFVGANTWTMPTTGNGINNSISIPEITNKIVTEGVVMLYQTSDNSIPNATLWKAMPYTDGIFSHSFEYTAGRVDLEITVTINGSRPTLAAAADFTYKVVIIAPANKIDGLDYTDYEAVKMVYGLEN